MIEGSQPGDSLMLNSGFRVKLKHKDERYFRVEMGESVLVEVDPAAVTMNITAQELKFKFRSKQDIIVYLDQQ